MRIKLKCKNLKSIELESWALVNKGYRIVRPAKMNWFGVWVIVLSNK